MAKEGKETTEYAVTKGVGLMAKVAVVLGAVLAVLPGIVESFPADSKVALWGGLALAALGVAAQVLAALGYQVSRTRVKEAEAAAGLPAAEPAGDAG